MSLVSLPNLQEMIDVISRERNLPKHAVENALREALLKGYERYRRTREIDTHFDEEYFDNFDIELDVDDYDDQGFRVLATKTIVDEVTSQDHEISLSEVREVAPEAQAGDTVVLDVTPDQRDFGRMAAIQTKQVLAQKLRDQQRKLVQEEFQDLEGSILSARVLRFERQSVIMAVVSGVGQPEVEAELLKRDQLPNDNYRANATFRVALKKVSEGSHRGPQLLVSRADAALVVELFTNEVPEIEDEIVRIVAVAREANPPSRSVGPRTKIAVDTLERDVDPVGACIGARGSRIQVVVNELRGEKIDVIRWSPDPATYISNALSPARVDEVRLVNPDDRQAHVLVPEDQLSLAIGKEGQNVRLAARLTGWKIDIKDSGKYDYDEEDRKIAEIAAAREEAAREAAELAAEEAEAAEWKAKAAAERAAAEARAAGLEVDEAPFEEDELEAAPLADAEYDANPESAAEEPEFEEAEAVELATDFEEEPLADESPVAIAEEE
ncbi:transcription termination factor NusA [Nodosilinea sp. FACHB-131]|uniref:transcription termination factor NusA n=1 Tax=Cyanophyceae TaxID=3028117 RepID=UPI00168283A3|nr:transcription termination factor NusA [Nodosilinea sp. FACHB-131]MBD1875739.1 transcription termination factor NusA [Nodosilinea sp. FACHB-131]